MLIKQEMMGGALASPGPCKSFAHRCRQITTPASHYSFLQARYSSWRPTNSVKALKAILRGSETVTCTRTANNMKHRLIHADVLVLWPLRSTASIHTEYRATVQHSCCWGQSPASSTDQRRSLSLYTYVSFCNCTVLLFFLCFYVLHFCVIINI